MKQTITLTLDDELFDQVKMIALQRKMSVQTLLNHEIASLIRQWSRYEQTEILTNLEIELQLEIPKHDPFQYSQAPTLPFQAVSSDDIRPFDDVENSAEFGKKLRQRAWRSDFKFIPQLILCHDLTE